MEFFASFWVGLFWFLVLLTPLIFVHEMGHFLVARWCGVRIDVFSIGFGKEIFGWNDRHGTRWKFSMIPLGGYIKMFGEHVLEPDEDGNVRELTAAEKAVSFQNKRLLHRTAIVAAGPGANYLFAMVVLAIMFGSIGEPVTPPVIGYIVPDSPAAEAGFENKDRVLAVDGDAIESYEQFLRSIRLSPGRTIQVTVLRDNYRIELDAIPEPREFDSITIGVLGAAAFLPAQIAEVVADSAAADAGLEPGDRILAIDDAPIELFEEMRRIVVDAPGQPLRALVLRDGAELEVTFTPRPREVTAEDGSVSITGLLGVTAASSTALVRHDPLSAIRLGGMEPIILTGQMLQGLGRIISGAVPSEELGGPIMIAQLSSKQASYGLVSFIKFMVLISINLGLINLLPIPVLDGGHLMFYAAEAVRGRPVGEKAQEYSFKIGLALVISLMIFVTVNDFLHRVL